MRTFDTPNGFLASFLNGADDYTSTAARSFPPPDGVASGGPSAMVCKLPLNPKRHNHLRDRPSYEIFKPTPAPARLL